MAKKLNSHIHLTCFFITLNTYIHINQWLGIHFIKCLKQNSWKRIMISIISTEQYHEPCIGNRRKKQKLDYWIETSASTEMVLHFWSLLTLRNQYVDGLNFIIALRRNPILSSGHITCMCKWNTLMNGGQCMPRLQGKNALFSVMGMDL